MGGYIGNPSDLQIVAALNLAFNSTAGGISKTRTYFGRETPFDGQHTLSRVAYRIGAYPTDQTSRGKWFGLLDHLANTVAQEIKDILQTALNDMNIAAVVFSVMPDPNNGPNYTVDTHTANLASYVTLLCPGHDYNGPAYPPGYVPPRDPGEPKSTKPMRRHSPPKRRRAGSSKKSKKKTKKANAKMRK